MSNSINKAILVGFVGKDPEIKAFQNGGRVANLSLATGESWKDKTTGERKERTEWHRVTITNDALVGVVEKYVRKGSKLYLEGQIETRKWTDKDGQERYATEIVLRPFHGGLVLLDKADGASGGERTITHEAAGRPIEADPRLAGGDLDDDIPF